jgi:hypothetical protein
MVGSRTFSHSLGQSGHFGVGRPLLPPGTDIVRPTGTSEKCQKQTCHTSIMLIHHDKVTLAKAPPSLLGDYAAGKVN